MYSLVDLDKYKEPNRKKQWGGYVLECAKDKAVYVGMSCDLDNRMKEHMNGGKQAARFVKRHGLPVRVLELYFCETEAQARDWERMTSEQLLRTYKNRPVYHLGYRSIDTPKPSGPKRWKAIEYTSKASMDAYSRLFKQPSK